MAITESIGEKSLSMIEIDRLRTEVAQETLALMGALLDVEGGGSLPELFTALRRAFACEQTLVLENHGGEFECTASYPARWTGQRWSTNVFLNVLTGSVLVNGGGAGASLYTAAVSDLMAPAQPGLSF